VTPAELRRRRAAAQLLAARDEARTAAPGASDDADAAPGAPQGLRAVPGAPQGSHAAPGASHDACAESDAPHDARADPDAPHDAHAEPDAPHDARAESNARQDAGAVPDAPRASVAHLLAVQAQDIRAARLALRARGGAASATDVEAALSAGSLVVAWLMRGTLHLVAREDHGWLHALTGAQLVPSCRRRLAQLGVTETGADRAADLIVRTLADDGPQTRAGLAERLAAAGLPTEGQITPHLLGLAAARGSIALGAGRAFRHLGAPGPRPDRATALAELARRYLRGHGPATATDLASWSGLPLRDARAGLDAIAPELEQHGDLVDLAGRRSAPVPPPRLLPAFDPYLLGWKDRSFAVAAEHARRVHPGGGLIRATAIARGAAVATWTLRAGRVALDPFAPLPARVEAALARDARDVERFV
jgi:Winged helix DNA-binding domain